MASSFTLAPAFNVIWTRHLLFVGSSVKYKESLCYCELTWMTEVKMLGPLVGDTNLLPGTPDR